jgi:hypothetical protein
VKHLASRPGTPAGRPSRWLGAEATAAVRTSIINAAWSGQRQIPRVVEQFNVQEMVEQKVLDSPPSAWSESSGASRSAS